MFRDLLILAVLLSGAGCAVSRPLVSTIVVTPPKVSFRPLPQRETWNWTAVGVTYPSESSIPAACAPSPSRPAEQFTFVDEDERSAHESPSGPAPSVTMVTQDQPVIASPLDPPAIVHLDQTTSPSSCDLPVSNVVPASFEITPQGETAVAITPPSESLSPPACAPLPDSTLQLVSFDEADECVTSTSPSEPAPASTTVDPVPSVNALNPSNRVGSSPSTESNWKPVANLALGGPVPASTVVPRVQNDTTPLEAPQVMPVENPSQPAMDQVGISELLTEIRHQRQLIEKLQRDLLRERSADDAAIEELEAAVENLLVHTLTVPRELPATMQK